jgi:hypothetical protein
MIKLLQELLHINNMSKSINTELPLSYDYFDQEEDQDTNTVREILAEYQQVGGLSMDYYCQMDEDKFMDSVFLEKADKKWIRPIKIKGVFEYLQEVIENVRYGTPVLDELNIITEKQYFLENIKREPKIGDLLKINHVNLMFEVMNVVDSEANFFGNKLSWKITAKIFKLESESDDIAKEIIDPGWMTDEELKDNIDINKKIATESEELHTYKPGESPFGNF